MTGSEKIPRSRNEARSIGVVSYFTGEECQNGHVDKRYTNTGICYACKRATNNRNYECNPVTSKARAKRDYKRNKENKKAASIRWKRENKERAREINRRNKAKHKDKYAAAEKIRVRKKIKSDPEYHTYKLMSKSIWQFLKMQGSSKNGSKWISLVDYETSDLRRHLEKQFDEHMTWGNYGSYWHIDHIVPKQYFIDHESNDNEYLFKCCWSLDNLRPLKAEDNLSKGDSTDEDTTQDLISKFDLK